MIMVLIKNTACIVLVFLCAAWLSTARLNPTGAEANEIPDMKASIATGTTKRTTVKSLAIEEGNLNKPSKVKSVFSVEDKRKVRRHYSDEVNGGLVAFTADYHRPVHHPPKNNK